MISALLLLGVVVFCWILGLLLGVAELVLWWW
jgi:hypothetical protein